MRALAAFIGFGIALLSADGAVAQVRIVSKKADQTALTIYPDNLALITESRTVNLPKGKSTLVFAGVSERMIPASVLLRAFSGFTLERNFDYKQLDKANLFAKSVGQYVTVTRTDPHSGKVIRERAKIVSAAQGVILEFDNHYEAFQCSGLSEGIRFDRLPEGLRGVPELSIDVSAPKAGPQTVVISYLTDKFGWEADYRMDITEQRQKAHLLGWLTLENGTSKSFKNAPLAIIAGTLNRGRETRAPEFSSKNLFANCWPIGSSKRGISAYVNDGKEMRSDLARLGFSYAVPSPMMQEKVNAYDEVVVTAAKRREVKQEDLGDYKLYRINEPVNVAAYQTKQIRFVKAKAGDYEKIYNFDIWLSGIDADEFSVQPARIEYRLNNDKDGEIAKALPKGTMRVFGRDKNGHRLVIGETEVKNTPVGNPMKIYLDKGQLVQVKTRTTAFSETYNSRLDANKTIINMEHVVSNASDQDIVIEMRIPGAYQSLKLNQLSDKLDTSVEPKGWVIKVPSGQTHTLSYRAQFY